MSTCTFCRDPIELTYSCGHGTCVKCVLKIAEVGEDCGQYHGVPVFKSEDIGPDVTTDRKILCKVTVETLHSLFPDFNGASRWTFRGWVIYFAPDHTNSYICIWSDRRNRHPGEEYFSVRIEPCDLNQIRAYLPKLKAMIDMHEANRID